MKNIVIKYSSIFRNIYTSIFATLMSLAFAKLYYSSTIRFKNESSIIFSEPHQLLFYNLLMVSIVIFAVIMIYYYFDNLDLFNKKDYLEDTNKKLLISKPEYLVGFAISLLFASSMLATPIHTLISTFREVNIAWARLLAVITLALIRFIQIYNLQVKWEDEIHHPLFVEKPIFKNSQDIKRFKPIYLFIKPLGYLVIFTFCYLFVDAYAIEIVFSLYIILTSLWQGILILVLIPFIVFFALRIVINLKARRKLIKKLKMLKREKLATVEYHGCRYLSSFLPLLPFSVTVKATSGEVYLCRIVCSGNVNAPMYFTTDKYYTEHGFHLRGGALLSSMGSSPFAAIVDIGKMGGKTNPTNLIAGYRREHKLTFPEKEGNRTLIINPSPTTCFSLYENIANPIDTGEDMGNYTIYTATGFYNMVERKATKDKFDQ